MRITTSKPVSNWLIYKWGVQVEELDDSPIKSHRIVDWLSDAPLGSCLHMFGTKILHTEHTKSEIFHIEWEEDSPMYLPDEGYHDQTSRVRYKREAIIDRFISLGNGLYQIVCDDKRTFQKCYLILDWNKGTLVVIDE